MKRKKLYLVSTICIVFLSIATFKILQVVLVNRITVEIDKKVYPYRQAVNILADKLKSNDMNEQEKALDILIKLPSESEPVVHNKKILNAALALYKKLPDIAPKEERDKFPQKVLEAKLKGNAFAILSHPKDKIVFNLIKDAMKSDSKEMREIARAVKKLIEDDINQQKGLIQDRIEMRKREAPIPKDQLIDVGKTDTGDLEVFMKKMLANASRHVRENLLEQIDQQQNSWKKQDEKRNMILSLLQKQYIRENHQDVEAFIIQIMWMAGKNE